MVFADRLRERRRELGKTVSQCAAFLQKTQPAWTLYETGKRLPKLDELLEICRLLDTTPNDLLGVSSAGEARSAVSSGSCAVSASGRGASAPSAAPGTLAQCAKCPHRKLADKMRKMIGEG